MRRSLSPILRRELENLDKDADSRKSAMKALKSYVKELDSKAIPLFLAQVSETKEACGSSGECTISLYEVLARVHGPKIVPQIDSIMATIIKTLTSSAGSFALHQACAKVVPAIARYGMDPTTPEGKKRFIIHSLCKPLSDCLLGSQESLSSGAALCLKALVDSDNWRFASNEMVNEVCQRVAGALEKHVQTNSHMALVMVLAKHNSLIVEAYARLLIQSGLHVLSGGTPEANSQKRLSSVHMVNCLMKCLDPKSLFSELGSIIEEMERCQSDKMPYVRGAAFEALQTAKRILNEKGSKFERDVESITGSNFGTSPDIRRNLWGSGDQSPLTASPESQTLGSFLGYDPFDSPTSVSQASHYQYDRRSVNRKLWRRLENGGLDISLKDGIFSEVSQGIAIQNSEHDKSSDNCGDHRNGFEGFLQPSSPNGIMRSTTPSPQRSHSHINVDNVKIFTTPRKLIRSLQDSDVSEKESRRFRSPTPRKFARSPMSKFGENGRFGAVNHENNCNENLSSGGEQSHHSSESVSSTDVFACSDMPQVVLASNRESRSIHPPEDHWSPYWKTVTCLLFVLLSFSVSLLWMVEQDEGHNLVPT